MPIRSLCSGAEDCVQTLGLTVNEASTIRSYLLNNAMPSSYFEMPVWVGFRVVEFVKNFFGIASARRDAIKILSDHLFSQKIANRYQTANQSVVEKVSKIYLTIASGELLSFAASVQADNKPSSNEITAGLFLIDGAIGSTLRDIYRRGHRF